MEASSSTEAREGEVRQVIEKSLLQALEATGRVPNSLDFAQQQQVDHAVVVSVLKKLASHEVIEAVVVEVNSTELTKEGQEVVQEGSPEARLFAAIDAEAGTPKADTEKLPFGKAGFSEAMKNKWITFDKASGKLMRQTSTIDDVVQQKLSGFKNGEALSDKDKLIFSKRKLLRDVKAKVFDLTKGEHFSVTGIKKKALDLTAEMIASGAWETETFKEYNFNALGTQPTSGHLHPLLKVRSAFREIFLEMGFEEMPTNSFVESSFWNFDTLFQPQQHPARDAHDTFFLSQPASMLTWPEDYLQRVHEMHEKGGLGSIGWRYDWKLDEAKKNILRTHTTSVSSRMLYKLGQQKSFTPKKYFSIDRVFRNETLDATHLAEFHQIEGLVADYDLTLADLIGVITQFFQKWGLTQLRFKPAYNPYTEPSMEIFAFHPGLKKWIEIGNSGMFRPEMLLPMGLDPKIKVLAWGLSLERPTMIRYGVKNFRDLVGHKCSLDFMRTNPVCDLQLDDKYDASAFVRPNEQQQ